MGLCLKNCYRYKGKISGGRAGGIKGEGMKRGEGIVGSRVGPKAGFQRVQWINGA